MKKYLMNFGALLFLSSCTTTQQTAKAGTSAPKVGTDKAEVVYVLEDEEANNGDFGKITRAEEVSPVDTTQFSKASLQKMVDEINGYMAETGFAYLTDKGIVVAFERGDMFGLSTYVPSNNAQSDYKKLIKALNTFKGTVVVTGKTSISASDKPAAEAEKRALRVARFISKSDIPKERILLDDMGVSISSPVARKARVSNKDRVVEFLLIPKKS